MIRKKKCRIFTSGLELELLNFFGFTSVESSNPFFTFPFLGHNSNKFYWFIIFAVVSTRLTFCLYFKCNIFMWWAVGLYWILWWSSWNIWCRQSETSVSDSTLCLHIITNCQVCKRELSVVAIMFLNSLVLVVPI